MGIKQKKWIRGILLVLMIFGPIIIGSLVMALIEIASEHQGEPDKFGIRRYIIDRELESKLAPFQGLTVYLVFLYYSLLFVVPGIKNKKEPLVFGGAIVWGMTAVVLFVFAFKMDTGFSRDALGTFAFLNFLIFMYLMGKSYSLREEEKRRRINDPLGIKDELDAESTKR